MNLNELETLFFKRKHEEDMDIFKWATWLMEYLPNGLEFLRHYNEDRLELLSKGYEIEGFSFLSMGIRDWKLGMSKIESGLNLKIEMKTFAGVCLIDETGMMLGYSHGDVSTDCLRLAEQGDELAICAEISSYYTDWIFQKNLKLLGR